MGHINKNVVGNIREHSIWFIDAFVKEEKQFMADLKGDNEIWTNIVMQYLFLNDYRWVAST
jgi:hypothetical protein